MATLIKEEAEKVVNKWYVSRESNNVTIVKIKNSTKLDFFIRSKG